ncbi:hypothetical protein [Rhizobium phage RHph_X2_30]|nr:hypothetical protein [Rhizobium phage RHph_X2_30]
MGKRIYRRKRKVDYMTECAALKREVERLQALSNASYKERLQGRLDAFNYAATEIEMAESLEAALSKIRQVLAETTIDFNAIPKGIEE